MCANEMGCPNSPLARKMDAKEGREERRKCVRASFRSVNRSRGRTRARISCVFVRADRYFLTRETTLHSPSPLPPF